MHVMSMFKCCVCWFFDYYWQLLNQPSHRVPPCTYRRILSWGQVSPSSAWRTMMGVTSLFLHPQVLTLTTIQHQVARFYVFVLFVFYFSLPLENFSLIFRRRLYHYWLKACKFRSIPDTHKAIDQWGFFLECHTYRDTGHLFIMISEDPWHSHLLLNIWQ